MEHFARQLFMLHFAEKKATYWNFFCCCCCCCGGGDSTDSFSFLSLGKLSGIATTVIIIIIVVIMSFSSFFAFSVCIFLFLKYHYHNSCKQSQFDKLSFLMWFLWFQSILQCGNRSMSIERVYFERVIDIELEIYKWVKIPHAHKIDR